MFIDRIAIVKPDFQQSNSDQIKSAWECPSTGTCPRIGTLNEPPLSVKKNLMRVMPPRWLATCCFTIPEIQPGLLKKRSEHRGYATLSFRPGGCTSCSRSWMGRTIGMNPARRFVQIWQFSLQQLFEFQGSVYYFFLELFFFRYRYPTGVQWGFTDISIGGPSLTLVRVDPADCALLPREWRRWLLRNLRRG